MLKVERRKERKKVSNVYIELHTSHDPIYFRSKLLKITYNPL